MKQLEQVKHFMTTFGQGVPTEPTLSTKEITDLRIKLSQEELDEYAQAVKDGDMVEIADALTDRLYVLLGDYVAHGLGDLLVPLFDEVQASNMSKLTADGKVLRREDGKILKSDQFFKPNLKAIIDAKLNGAHFGSPGEPQDETVDALRSAMKPSIRHTAMDHNQLRALLDAGRITFAQYLKVIK
jgi:predicted HAD superfamily Cof-like phosphohydrolase